MRHYHSRIVRRRLLGCLAVGFLQLATQARLAVAADTQPTRAQKEAFLLKAKIVKTQHAAKGITDTVRATLNDGTSTHDASIQTHDEYKQIMELPSGNEFNFKDTWKFNVAAYKLDRLLGLNMVPATVERQYEGKSGSFTWWVDDVAMDEENRLKRKAESPDPTGWNNQMHIVRVFDQLIFNTDRNLGNLLIDKNWQIWMIDHTRAFRTLPNLRRPKDLERCDRDLLEKLKQLNPETLKQELGKYLSNLEIKGLLSRRDKIVKAFEEQGPSALYETRRRPD